MVKPNPNSRGVTLVELMVIVVIVGVLASIGIPTFLRYIKQSKTAEAESIMKKMAEGAKAYFVSEQRFSASDGDAPWHPGSSGSASPGLPVPWTSYVFPGGELASINTSEPECTGGAPDSVGAPTRGQKIIPCLGVPPASGSVHAGVLNKLRVSLGDPLYFKYFYEASGAGYDATGDVWAIADFVAGGPAHSVRMTVSVQPDQEVVMGPAVVVNEFE